MATIFLIIGIVGTVVFALNNLRKARTATPANRVMIHNTARMLLSVGAIFAGGLLGGIAAMPLSIPAIGWAVTSLLVLATLTLIIGGIVGAIICIVRIGPIKQRIIHEASPWASRP
jgi:hypothetical protein